MNLRALVWFSLTVWLLPIGVADAGPASSGWPPEEAVRRGVLFLKRQQLSDGSWEYKGHRVGMTALAGLALVENGVVISDPAVQGAYRYVRMNAPSQTQTYDISLAILFLVRIGSARDSQLIHLLGQRLAAGQLASGGWTYTCPQTTRLAVPARLTNKRVSGQPASNQPGRIRASRRGSFGDNSNTQFAVLGIWAVGQVGLDIAETMELVDRRFRSTQFPSGGWSYRAGRREGAAMTCAGLMALALAKGHKTLQEATLVNRRPGTAQALSQTDLPKMDSDPQIERGIGRVEHFASRMSMGSNLYFFWSLERVAVALGMTRIGRVDWYGRGAAILLRTQQPDGSWRTTRGKLPDTSFALLFLRRSNLTKGMPQLVTSRGDDPRNNQLRPGTLDELQRTVHEPAADVAKGPRPRGK